MIDTHSHLFVEEFDEDLPAVIERARDSGVSKVFMPNIDDTTVEAMLNVCTAYKGYCFPMIGFHPTSVGADSLWRRRSPFWRTLPARSIPPSISTPFRAAARARTSAGCQDSLARG